MGRSRWNLRKNSRLFLFFIGVGVEPTRGNLLLVLERRSNTGPGFRLMVDVDVDAVRVERSGATCSSKYYYCSSKYYYSPLISCLLRLIWVAHCLRGGSKKRQIVNCCFLFEGAHLLAGSGFEVWFWWKYSSAKVGRILGLKREGRFSVGGRGRGQGREEWCDLSSKKILLPLISCVLRLIWVVRCLGEGSVKVFTLQLIAA